MSSEYRNLWWALEGTLAGMAMPFVHPDRRMNHGGALDEYEDELPRLHAAGIRAIVCLLNLPGDAAMFQAAGFDYRCFPVGNGWAPTVAQAREFIEFVEQCRSRNLPVAVYCEAGAGRTGTMIACYFIHLGRSAETAIAELRAIDLSAVETDRQIKFLEEFEKQQRKNG